MKSTLEFIVSGIKCDNPFCSYVTENVKREDWYRYIGKPCPVCGATLLTQKDFDTTVGLDNLIKKLDKILGPLSEDTELVTLETEIIMDGSGEYSFGATKLTGEECK